MIIKSKELLPISADADLAAPALRAFFGIVKTWSLDETEQMAILGVDSHSTLHSWKAEPVAKITRDLLERISYVLEIFEAINTILPVPERADAWMRAPNKAPIFNGLSALDRMTSGNVSDLYVVCQYLAAQRG